MSKNITGFRVFATILIASVVLVMCTSRATRAADVLINPNFAFDGGGWTGANTAGVGNPACSGGLPNIGTWTVNALSFSYAWSTVTQAITISTPSTVFFDWSSINRGDASGATARVTLADTNESLNTGLITSPTSGVSRSLGPITTTSDNETVTISIYGKDSVGWAGCYGTQFTVSALDVVPVSPPTTTTTTLDNIGAPTNLTATDIGTAIRLDWSAPSGGGYLPERYAISLNTAGQNGWGVATGNVGGTNALNTTYTISYSLLESLMPSGTTWLFHIRSDNDTFSKYSANSNVVSIQVGTPLTTTTTTVPETTTTTTVPETTTTTTQPPETSTSTTTTTTSLPPETTTTPVATTPTVETVPPTTTTTTTTTEVPTTTTSEPPPIPIDTTTTLPPPIAPTTTVPRATTVAPTTTTTTTTTITPTTTTVTPPTTTVPAIIPVIVAGISTIESQSVSSEQVAEVVTEVLKSGVSSEQATELASSAKVLESISGDQATEVFASVSVSELTAEDGQAIVDAVQDAPTEVREAFEEEVDVFAGVFDEYVPTTSTISVGVRRSVIAVNLVASVAVAAAMGASGGNTPSTPSPSSSPMQQNIAARKEEEEQEGGEIAGDGSDWLSQLSIFVIIDGRRVFSWRALMKKFTYALLNMGFTIAGAVVLYFTLSGTIQMIAVTAFGLALIAQMFVAMKEPD